MKKAVATLIVLLFCFCLLVSTSGIAFSSSDNWNWVELERITGNNYYVCETEPFNINSSVAVWRIVWDYTPRTDVPEHSTGITINLYAGASGDDKLLEIGRKGLLNGDEDCRYFHEEGVFRLKISTNTQKFTIRIEQSIGYTPEPPTDNWAEVTRFIGTKGFTTDIFVCEYPEWRIKWEYDPGHTLFPIMAEFQATTYPEGSSTITVDVISGTPDTIQNGTSYVHENPGRFYMKISTGIIENYIIIVEQNTESTPKPESNWVEVVTFTHSVSGLAFLHPTSHFTVDYADWRIRWEVNPGNVSERGTSFHAYVFPETSGKSIEEMHYTIGTEKTTGIKNIYNRRGSFYIVVQTTNIADIKLIIEQNIDSIPEFPSWTPLLITIVAVVSVIVIYRRKLSHRKVE
jgi:hypothetical protein